VNVDTVRAFVLVAELGRFQDAAAELGITQQAVSKRVATLEHQVGASLLVRDQRGARLTADGEAFLPYARQVLIAVQAALASIRPLERPLRVDVLGTRLVPAELVVDFHRTCPDRPIEMVSLRGNGAAFAALLDGAIDAAFCSPGAAAVPGALNHRRVYDEPLELLVGPGHPVARARTIRLRDLTDHPIWVPGIVEGSEWGDFYAALAEDFGLRIDATGPNFGADHLLGTIAGSLDRATFVGPRFRTAGHDVRRIPVRRPTPVYPWSLAWHRVNSHPGLADLRGYLGALPPSAAGTWTPPWAKGARPGREVPALRSS
jgi:DNA-binding transcriptional LysR family regulator